MSVRHSFCRHHPLRRENKTEHRASTYRAFDREYGTMTLSHMLDDGQPQTGATGFPGTATVHTIKAFCQAAQVFRCNPRACIGD